MATETDHHHHQQSYCSNNWSQSEIPSVDQHSQGVSISDILDNGSISFGKFAGESLAWEKWSVFSHNRCQEELEKFKAPGFVAQKKAYFEEYYKKVRAMKTLQTEQQLTTHPDPCQVAVSNITQVGNGVNADVTKEEKEPINVVEVQILEKDATANLDSYVGGILDISEEATKEELSYRHNDNDNATVTDKPSNSLSTIEPEHSVKEASSSPTSSVNRSSETAQLDCPVSNTAKHDTNKQKQHAPVIKAKVTLTSAENKTKLEGRITKSAVQPSERQKPTIRNKITGKADNSLVSTKGSIPKIADDISSNNVLSRRQLSEVRSSTPLLRTSLVRDRLVTSASGRGDQMKANSTSKGLADKLQAKLPLHAQSVQSISKETSFNGGLRKDAQDNRRSHVGDARKPSELSGCQTRPKGRVCENQRPKTMYTNLHARNNLNQNVEVEFGRRSYVKGQPKKGEEKSTVGLIKDSKSSSSTLSSIRKAAPNPKPFPKIALSRSPDLTHLRKEPRPQMPSWR